MTVPVITIDEDQLRRGMRLTKESFDIIMRDTKALAPYASGWVKQALGIDLPEDNPLGSFRIGSALMNQMATIRTFRGARIGLQQSSRRGGRRDGTSTLSDMLDDVERVDYFIFCDCRKFPDILIYPVRTVKLFRFLESQDIPKTGIRTSKFDRFIRDNYDIEFVPVDLKRGPVPKDEEKKYVGIVQRRR